jgi:hypothetical protein
MWTRMRYWRGLNAFYQVRLEGCCVVTDFHFVLVYGGSSFDSSTISRFVRAFLFCLYHRTIAFAQPRMLCFL